MPWRKINVRLLHCLIQASTQIRLRTDSSRMSPTARCPTPENLLVSTIALSQEMAPEMS